MPSFNFIFLNQEVSAKFKLEIGLKTVGIEILPQGELSPLQNYRLEQLKKTFVEKIQAEQSGEYKFTPKSEVNKFSFEFNDILELTKVRRILDSVCSWNWGLKENEESFNQLKRLFAGHAPSPAVNLRAQGGWSKQARNTMAAGMAVGTGIAMMGAMAAAVGMGYSMMPFQYSQMNFFRNPTSKDRMKDFLKDLDKKDGPGKEPPKR